MKILRFKKFNPNQDWKLKVFIMNTWINALNFWTILIWLKFFKIYEIPSFTIDIFPGHLLNSFLGFVIIFALPFAVINYFLIFRNNRYLMLIKKYDTIKTPYALIYCFGFSLRNVGRCFKIIVARHEYHQQLS